MAISLKLLLAHFQFHKFQPYTLFHSPRKHLRNTRGKINSGRTTHVQERGRGEGGGRVHANPNKVFSNF